ncbi:MAG: D-alanyl-D-alanine dipeptidase [Shewanella sp.]|nr:D-alanyl-D-alanine dipeptidase [Shewanella sp.]
MTTHASELIEITSEKHQVLLELAYASTQNFTQKSHYLNPKCFLHRQAESNLTLAVNILKPLGLKLKIWDGFRPLRVQQALFDFTPDPNYVSHPQTGRRPHCRGTALDVTLVDEQNNELDMGTGFDDFRMLAHHGNTDISTEAQRNRLLLAGVMSVSGFEAISSEWWHYQLSDLMEYPIITDVDF